MKKKCIIFGASQYGHRAYKVLNEIYEIIGFADNDSKKWGKEFCEKIIYKPEKLLDMQDLHIVIASQYYSAINSQLHSMGLKNIKVFYYCGKVLEDIDNKGYKIYSISEKKLFQDCIFDKEKIRKVRDNFSENYEHIGELKKIRLKETNRKKVLFCAYNFPPTGGSGVQRSLKFVKYLIKFGYEPIVLTVGEHEHKFGEDYTLLEEIKGIQVIRIDNVNFIPEILSKDEQQEIFNLYAGIVQSEDWIDNYLEVIKSDANLKLIPDNRICWVNECLKQIEGILDLTEITAVYTTGEPFSTYILGFYLKQKYGMKWVQDYRDPWMTNNHYIRNYYKNDASTMELQQILEKELTREADAIIVVAKAFMGEYTERYGVDKEKIIEITNGYDEEDFRGIEVPINKNNKFTLCYNGSLYVNRSPLNLLNIINGLIENNKLNKDEILWIFNGTLENQWRKELEKRDKYKIIQYNGYLNHIESIKETMQADILVLFGEEGEGTHFVYTGKIFEYIRMKRKILSFSSKGGVLEDILNKTKTGKNFEYDDFDGISKWLMDNYTVWKNEENRSVFGDDIVIKKYSREYTTSQLAKVFDKVLERN